MNPTAAAMRKVGHSLFSLTLGLLSFRWFAINSTWTWPSSILSHTHPHFSAICRDRFIYILGCVLVQTHSEKERPKQRKIYINIFVVVVVVVVYILFKQTLFSWFDKKVSFGLGLSRMECGQAKWNDIKLGNVALILSLRRRFFVPFAFNACHVLLSLSLLPKIVNNMCAYALQTNCLFLLRLKTRALELGPAIFYTRSNWSKQSTWFN